MPRAPNRFSSLSSLFPRAALYRELGRAPAGRVKEDAERFPDFPWTERHLQCVWYDPSLRPAKLVTHTGESLVVEDPGVWNLEAGPDFLGARVRIGGRRLAGDVEVHVHPRDWPGHGHGEDPRYARVRLHVTWAPGVAAPGLIHVSLKAALAADPLFSFELIDPSAYPYGPRAAPAPCSRVLSGWAMADKEQLLEAAGEERLRGKAERFARYAAERGREQAFYEEVLSALGYKHNKAPFRLLAQRVPLNELRKESGGSRMEAYAVLAGMAGLLPPLPATGWDMETRRFFRQLWDAWWKRQESWASRALPRGIWRFNGLRPANRPERRLMAAAVLFSGPASLLDDWRALARTDARTAFERAEASLCSPSGTYWDCRVSWGGARLKTAAALIGPSRARAIVNNLFLPYLASTGTAVRQNKEWLDHLPPEEENQVLRQTARSLLGPDYPPSLLRNGLRQQGLIQIFSDYCLNDRSRCATCTFPKWLSRRTA